MSHMNLLPFALLRRDVVLVRLKCWCLVWSACAVLSAVWYAVAASPVAAERVRVERLEARAAPLRRLIDENEGIRARLQGLAQHESVASRLAGDEQALSFVELVSRGAREAHQGLQVQRLKLSQFTPPAPKSEDPGAPAPQRHTKLSVSGIAVDDLAVSAFVSVLRAADFFTHVELKSSRATDVAGRTARLFELECLR